jgi:hypothetical protein
MKTGSVRFTPVWNGLWQGKHIRRMKEAVYLFGFLLSCANKEGVVRTSYRDLSNKMDVAERTLAYWMATLKREGYVEVKKSTTMVITIQKFRRIKSKKDGGNLSQDHAGLADKTSQLTTRSNNETSQSPAKLNSANADKQGCSRDSLNAFKIKDNNKTYIYRVFDFWNEQNIIQHRDINKFVSCINACLKNYSVDEITGAIKNYRDVLTSSEHFFSYRWALSEFLSRKNGLDKFMDREIAFRNYRSATSIQAGEEEVVVKRTEEEERVWQERIRRGSEADKQWMGPTA